MKRPWRLSVLLVPLLLTGCGGDSISPGGDPTSELAMLEAALTSDDPETRAEAAKKLGELGPEGAPAVPDLKEALDDSCSGVAVAAAEALGEIGTPEAAEALEHECRRPRRWGHRHALRALGRMGTRGGWGMLHRLAGSSHPEISALSQELIAALEEYLNQEGVPHERMEDATRGKWRRRWRHKLREKERDLEAPDICSAQDEEEKKRQQEEEEDKRKKEEEEEKRRKEEEAEEKRRKEEEEEKRRKEEEAEEKRRQEEEEEKRRQQEEEEEKRRKQEEAEKELPGESESAPHDGGGSEN